MILDLLSDSETYIDSKAIEPEDFENGKIITYGALYILEDSIINFIISPTVCLAFLHNIGNCRVRSYDL